MMNLSVDIETLGTRVDAPILSIGAVFFSPQMGKLGEEFYAAIRPSSAALYGKVDIDTVQWWMKQEAAARDAAFAGTRELAEVLCCFAEWVKKHATNMSKLGVWANGPSFDISILEYAYGKALKSPPPWRYNSPRCVRTINALLGDRIEWKPMTGVQHNSLDDAKAQAERVMELWRLLLNEGSSSAVPTQAVADEGDL